MIHVVADQLGDAEIEQLRAAFAVHEDVARLEIAVHDQVAVRELDGLAHAEEALHARTHVERMLVAPAVDGQAVHELHDEVGLAVGRRAAVEQSRDVRVREGREQLALAAESPSRSWVSKPGRISLSAAVIANEPSVRSAR
ncbi:MAG: hypothetical protein U0704_06935 [Candidatus Eisenbacteria bacterium]